MVIVHKGIPPNALNWVLGKIVSCPDRYCSNFHKHVVIGVAAIYIHGMAWFATHTCVIKMFPVLVPWNWATWIVCMITFVGKSSQIHWSELALPTLAYAWDACVRALLPCSQVKALQGSKYFKSATRGQRQVYAAGVPGCRDHGLKSSNHWSGQWNFPGSRKFG